MRALADELRTELQGVGVIVIGPVGQFDAAIDLSNAEPRTDGAILDVNLGGESVFAAADILAARGVPMVLTSYDASSIPERYGHIVRFEKPLSMPKVADAMARDPRHGGPATFERPTRVDLASAPVVLNVGFLEVRQRQQLARCSYSRAHPVAVSIERPRTTCPRRRFAAAAQQLL